MMKRNQTQAFRATAVLCVLLLLAVVLSAVKAANTSGRLEQEQKAHSAAASQLQQIQKENRELQKQVSGLTSETTQLKEGNRKLQEKYDRLKKAAVQKSGSAPKTAYLTFDDGPSLYTRRLLDTLKSADVRATFFVVGTYAEKHRDIVKAEHDGGHAVGIHCYNHSYPSIYASQKAFSEDYGKMQSLLTGILGTSPDICRFPGGTSNTVSNRYGGPHFMKNILPAVDAMGLTPFDWNVDSGDADSASVSSGSVVNNIVRQVKGSGFPVILCHDSKKNTVAAIPAVIKRLKSMGFSFGVLSPAAPVCIQNAA